MPLHRRATPEVRASSDSLLSFSVVSTASRCTSESGGAAIHERLEIDDQLDLLEIFGTDEAYFEFERALDAAVEKEVKMHPDFQECTLLSEKCTLLFRKCTLKNLKCTRVFFLVHFSIKI